MEEKKKEAQRTPEINKVQEILEKSAPEEPKVEEKKDKRGYAILDLHLNQFLSFIAEEYSFLPCAIYRPRIDVHLNGHLVYKSKVLSHTDDVFGNVLRLHIQVPNSVLTLKLYECVQLRLTEHCVDELVRPVLKDEPMDEVLISWCDIELGLLLPFKKYDILCAFRVNPTFQHYNPGGILYYPTYKGKPFIDNKRVCCACLVCVLLASQTTTVHQKMLNKYFDFKCDDQELEIPDTKAQEEEGDATQELSKSPKLETQPTDNADKKQKDNESPSRKTEKESPAKVLKPTEHMDYGDEESLDDVTKDTNKVETFEMNIKKVFFTKEGCTCCRLVDVAKQLRGVNYSPCLCCHDYQVCCEHSVENYYYTSVSLKLVSKDSIDFKTELLALMNNPIPVNETTNSRTASLCYIVTRCYELYSSFSILNKHVGIYALSQIHRKYLYALVMLLLIGIIFEGKTLTVSCLLMAFLTMYIKNTSTAQFTQDWGDVIQASKRLTFSGQGLEKVIREMIEEDEANQIQEPVNRLQRNMPYIPKHEFVEEVKIYTKVNTSLNRCENIALKTMTNFLSSSVPKKVRKFLVNTLNFVDGVFWYCNSLLAIIRWYGVPISIFFCCLALLSLRYAFWMKCFIKTVIILLGTSTLIEDHPAVRLFFFQLKGLLNYLAMRVRRREWFLNVEFFP